MYLLSSQHQQSEQSPLTSVIESRQLHHICRWKSMSCLGLAQQYDEVKQYYTNVYLLKLYNLHMEYISVS